MKVEMLQAVSFQYRYDDLFITLGSRCIQIAFLLFLLITNQI